MIRKVYSSCKEKDSSSVHSLELWSRIIFSSTLKNFHDPTSLVLLASKNSSGSHTWSGILSFMNSGQIPDPVSRFRAPTRTTQEKTTLSLLVVFNYFFVWSGIIFSSTLKNFHDPDSLILLTSKT